MKQVADTSYTRSNLLIAVGSNVHSCWGDAASTVLKSTLQIGERFGGSVQTSAFYETPAFPEGAGPPFVNAAMAVDSDLSARDVLSQLHAIEAEALRSRETRWGARTLDLDLIAYDHQVTPSREVWQHWCDLPLERQIKEAPDQLILPHPRLQDRSFVLRPLLDVAPDWRHPILGLTIAQMLADRPQQERDSVVLL